MARRSVSPRTVFRARAEAFAEGNTLKSLPSPHVSRNAQGYLENISDTPEKQGQRERVLAFLMDNHRYVSVEYSDTELTCQRYVKLFSFPSEHWKFEHMLRVAAGKIPVFHAALEWNHPTMIRGLRHIPGRRCRDFNFVVDDGELWGHETDCARIVLASARTFFTPRIHPSRQGKWTGMFRRWTCAWLDFTSCLGAEIITSCYHLHENINILFESVPVCISFMAGRETKDVLERINSCSGKSPIEKRVSLVRSLLECHKTWRFEYKESFLTRPQSAHMITVCGVFHRSIELNRPFTPKDSFVDMRDYSQFRKSSLGKKPSF